MKTVEFLLSAGSTATLIVLVLWLRDRKHRRTADRLLEQRIRDRQDVGLD